jgi:hypothetical protein
MKIGFSILVLSLCLSLSIASSVSQLGPFVQVPTNIAAGSLATATILPVSLAAGSPHYVSSFSIYLAVAASTSRLGSGVLDAQCK